MKQGAAGSEPCRQVKGDWLFVMVITLLSLIAVNAAWAYGCFSAGEDTVFTGVHTRNAGDTYTYLAWMQQAREGHLLFRQLYTSEPHPALFFQPFFLLLGWIGFLTGLSNIVVFHGARIVLGLILAPLFYEFTAIFLREKRERRMALVFFLFASGWGWLLGGMVPDAIDRHLPEAVTFLSLLESPLNLVSLIFLVLIFTRLMRYWQGSGSRQLLHAGFLLSVLGFIHQYDVVTVLGVAGAMSLLLLILRENDSKSLGRGWLTLFLFALPPVLYTTVVLLRVDVFRSWLKGNILPPPTVAALLCGMGPLLIIALTGGWRMPRRTAGFLYAWILTAILLLYLPVQVGRKFMEGIHIPIAILAAGGYHTLVLPVLNRWKAAGKNKWLHSTVYLTVFLLLLLSTFMTNLGILMADLNAFRQGKLPYYFSRCLYEGFAWLEAHTSSRDIVFSASSTGYFIPGISGNIVYCCHRDQTVDVEKKKAKVYSFFRQGNPCPECMDFLKENRIQYLFFSFKERHLGRFDPGRETHLEPVFTNPCVTIYKVRY